MTVEELKVAAAELGYRIVKKQRTEKFLPCTCGSNRRETWFGPDGCSLICIKCGKRSKGKTISEAKHNWNLMILEGGSNETDTV